MGNIDRILRAKVQLQKKNPFYAHILLSIVHKPDTSIPTACINIKGQMRYNPKWIDSLTEEEVENVLKHEALHLILEHLKRRIRHITKFKILCERVWGISEDMVVNDILVSSGAKLPEGVVPEREVWGANKGKSTHRFVIEELGITIENIDKKTVEFINDEIMKQLPLGKGQGKGEGSISVTTVGGGGGDQNQQEDQQEDQQDEGEDQQEDQQEGDEGQGDQQEDQQISPEEQEILDKLPKGFDEHERPEKEEMTKKEQEEQLKRWRRKFVEAVEIGKMRGDLPAGMERLCGELFKEKLNWKAILWRYITQAIPYDYYWGKPSRKSYVVSEMFGQQLALPNVSKEKIEVIIAVDTSGSISKEELSEFASEMAGITKSFHNVDMLVIVCDCNITDKPIDLRNANAKDIVNLKFKGGGGTSHIPVYDWIRENKPNAKLVICLTDGYTDFPDKKDVRIKTLWVLGGVHCGKDKIPYGDVVEIPKYD